MSEVTPWAPCPKAIARVTDPLPAPTTCPHCRSSVELTSHDAVYGRTLGNWPWLYRCTGCDARVGMHPRTNIPLGTLATAPMREARKRCKAQFEAIHQTGRMSRRKAYQALADRLGIPVNECHFGWFDVEMCEKAEKAAREIYLGTFTPDPRSTGRVPAWFEAGAVVDDVFRRSDDAAAVFEPEDLALDWRECLVPIDEFELAADRDGFLSVLPGELRDNAQRYQSVHDWVKDVGGIDVALQTSPLLCFLYDGKLLLDDGWHRLGVAAYEYGAGKLRVLCAQGLPALGN